MRLKIDNSQRNVIPILGIGCVVCLLLGFGILLHAQEKTKADFIGTKSEMDSGEDARSDKNEGANRGRNVLDFANAKTAEQSISEKMRTSTK